MGLDVFYMALVSRSALFIFYILLIVSIVFGFSLIKKEDKNYRTIGKIMLLSDLVYMVILFLPNQIIRLNMTDAEWLIYNLSLFYFVGRIIFILGHVIAFLNHPRMPKSIRKAGLITIFLTPLPFVLFALLFLILILFLPDFSAGSGSPGGWLLFIPFLLACISSGAIFIIGSIITIITIINHFVSIKDKTKLE